MRKGTFAAVAGVSGGLGVAAALAATAITGEALAALPPVPTLTATTPVATATVSVPPPPPVTTAVPVPPLPVTTAVAPPAPPPPPPPAQTVVSAVTNAAAPVTNAVAPVTNTAAGATGAAAGAAAAGAVSSAPSASAPSARSVGGAPPPAAGGSTSGVAATLAAAPTGPRARTAPTLRARRTPGRVGARRLVLRLAGPRELTVLFRGPGETCRVAGRMLVHGRRGRNVVALNGRVRGGRLAPGVFRVEVLDTTGTGERMVGRLAVLIRYDARGRAHVRQVRYVPRDCALGVAALVASSLRVVGERATPAPATAQAEATSTRPTAASPTVDVRDNDTQEGGLAALPNLAPGDAVGGSAAALLIGLLLLSVGAFLLVAGGSAVRSLRR